MNERLLTITTVAAVAAAVVAVVLAVVDVFAKTFDIPLGVYLSCILFVLAAHLSYVYARTEDLQRRTLLIERRMAGATVEVFRTRDEWLQRIIELGTNSPFIATLHYSDPPSLLGGRSDEYFRRLDGGGFGRARSRRRFWSVCPFGFRAHLGEELQAQGGQRNQ